MMKQFEGQMSIIRQAVPRCKIYAASYNAQYWYPYKLTKAGRSWDALDRSCIEMILDSNVQDESVTNEEVLEEAIDSQPAKVIPKDYVDDPEATRESLIEFEELAADEPKFYADIIPVIQGDHVAHLEKYADFYGKYSYLAIGGMLGIKPIEQVRIIKDIRNHVGNNTYLHGFGMGTSLHLIKALRENPKLLDSIDMATAETMVKNGKTTDWTFKQREPEFPMADSTGDVDMRVLPMPYGNKKSRATGAKSVVNGGFSMSALVMLNFMMTDLVDDDRLEEMFYDQLGFDELEQIMINADSRDRSEMDFSGLNAARDTSGSATLDSFS